MILEDECGALSVADRKLFFDVFERDARIATLPDAWAISTIVTRMRKMKLDNGPCVGLPGFEKDEPAPEEKPAEGSIAALHEWMRAADDDVLRRSRAIIDAECTRRKEAQYESLRQWGSE